MFFLVNFILTQYVGVVNTAPGRKSWGVEELAGLLAVGFSFRCCSTPFLWSCPKKRGGAPKKNAFGWWRPREVSGPTRLSHSRGSCHSAAKVSASRTDWITRRHGEGLGLEVDWRLKVFCPAFLQKSGRGPGAEPFAARRSARNSPCAHKAQEGVKGGTLAGGSPFAGGLSRPQPVRPRGAGGEQRQGSSRTPTPTGRGEAGPRAAEFTWCGSRRGKW